MCMGNKPKRQKATTQKDKMCGVRDKMVVQKAPGMEPATCQSRASRSDRSTTYHEELTTCPNWPKMSFGLYILVFKFSNLLLTIAKLRNTYAQTLVCN